MSSNDDAAGETRYRIMPPKAVLRAVSGPYFGKVIPIYGRLEIGRGSECDLVLDEPEMSRKHAFIEVSSSEIFLRDLGSSNGTFVNGVQVRDAVLHPGDQLAFDRNRFLLEAPGMPARREDAQTPKPPSTSSPAGAVPNITQTMRAVPRNNETPDESLGQDAGSGSSWNPWALIGAAALIAAAIALLIFAR